MINMVQVRNLQPGDQLDLYGDKYADPSKDLNKGFEYELVTVERVISDSLSLGTGNDPEVTVVYTEVDGTFLFPHTHEVQVVTD